MKLAEGYGPWEQVEVFDPDAIAVGEHVALVEPGDPDPDHDSEFYIKAYNVGRLRWDFRMDPGDETAMHSNTLDQGSMLGNTNFWVRRPVPAADQMFIGVRIAEDSQTDDDHMWLSHSLMVSTDTEHLAVAQDNDEVVFTAAQFAALVDAARFLGFTP